MEIVLGLLSVCGINGILLFFVKRYFDRRDEQEQTEKHKHDELLGKVETSLETLRLLAYARMSEETERLLTQGYATPAERRILDELFKNYSEHGWNGDMDERLKKVYHLRTKQPASMEEARNNA